MRHRRLRIPSRLQEVRNHLNDREKGGSSGVPSFLAYLASPLYWNCAHGRRQKGLHPGGFQYLDRSSRLLKLDAQTSLNRL